MHPTDVCCTYDGCNKLGMLSEGVSLQIHLHDTQMILSPLLGNLMLLLLEEVAMGR